MRMLQTYYNAGFFTGMTRQAASSMPGGLRADPSGMSGFGFKNVDSSLNQGPFLGPQYSTAPYIIERIPTKALL